MGWAMIDILAGSARGMAQVGVGHPLDTVKVRLQTHNRFRGAWDCSWHTLRQEGVRRNVTPPLFPPFPSQMHISIRGHIAAGGWDGDDGMMG